MQTETVVAIVVGFLIVVALQVWQLLETRGTRTKTNRRLDDHEERIVKLEQQMSSERTLDQVALRALLNEGLEPVRVHVDERLDRQEQKIDELLRFFTERQA